MLCCAIGATATVYLNGQAITKGSTYSSSTYGITSGDITYNSSGQLILNNVTMYTSQKRSISTDEDLTIVLIGTNKVTSALCPLNLSGNMKNINITIKSNDGKGKLTAKSTDNTKTYAVLRNGYSTISIEKCDVTLEGIYYPIWSGEPNSSYLNVTDSRLTIKNTGGTTSTVGDLYGLTLSGCSLQNGYVFSNGAIRYSSTNSDKVTGTVTIEPDAYPLYLKGIQVNRLNMGDILGDGKVSFTTGGAMGNTLRLKDGTNIEYSGNALKANMKLNVLLSGSATFTTTGKGNSTIYLQGSYDYYFGQMANVSNTTLNVYQNSENGSAIHLPGNNQSIHFVVHNINLRSGYQGLSSANGGECYFYGNKAIITPGSNKMPIYGFSNIFFDGCEVSKPSGAIYNTTTKCFKTGTTNVVDTLTIQPIKYDIYVAGVQVTGQNMYAIDGTSSVKYDTKRNEIQLYNANISATGVPGIKANIPINIKVTGTNTVASDTKQGIYLYKSGTYTIDGTGTLNATTSGSTFAGLLFNGTLNIKNCTVNAQGGCGISGVAGETLVFNNANVTAKHIGTTAYYGALYNIKSLTYTDCYLASPTSGWYSTTNKSIMNNGAKAGSITVAQGTDNINPVVPNTTISVSEITETSCKVAWNPAQDNTTPIEKLIYKVEYKSQGAAGWTIPEVGNATSYTITGLKPSTTYRLDILVKDEAGNYKRYGEKTFTTADIAKYGLYVKGVEVTSLNKNDILGDGKVKYDDTDNLLTLNNATITTSGTYGINKSGDLHIKLIGNNSITSTSTMAIASMNYLDIYGDDDDFENNTLTLKSEDGACDLATSNGMVIRDCSVFAAADISGMGNNTLTVNNALVHAKYIWGFASIVCNSDIIFDADVECHYDTNKKKFVDAENEVHAYVTIRPVYLSVNGVAVTSYNSHDILGNKTAMYEPAAKNLILNGANIGVDGIQSYDDLNIKLKGFNFIFGQNSGKIGILQNKGSLNIEGPGYLYVQGFEDAIVNWYGSGTNTFKNCTLNLKSSSTCIMIGNGNVVFDAADVTLNSTGSDSHLIYISNGLTLKDCRYVSDSHDEDYLSTNYNYIMNEEIRVVPDRTFTLEIAGEKVTDRNKDDVLGDGKVKYDPDNKILWLNNVTIEEDKYCAIRQYEGDLTIYIEGENSLTSKQASIDVEGKLVICSNSINADENILRATSTGDFYTIAGDTTIIANCTIFAEYIAGEPDGESTLIIENSHVESMIHRYANVNLIHSYYVSDGYYNEERQQYLNSKDQIATAVILPATLMIGNNVVTKDNCTDILGDKTVSYDYDTNTLTLNNAHLINENIYSVKELNIKLIGKNSFEDTNDSWETCIHIVRGHLLIKGPGSLSITDYTYGIVKWAYDNKNFDFENCSLFIENATYPICCDGCTVSFNNTDATLNSYSRAIICENIELKNGKCTVPQTLEELIAGSTWDGPTCNYVVIESTLLLGDANNDNELSISDLPALIQAIKDSTNLPQNDVNLDGTVDLEDVKALEEILLNK